MKSAVFSMIAIFLAGSISSICCAQNAYPEMRIYPSWEQPKFAFRTRGIAACNNSRLLAKNTDGVLRLYNFKTADDCIGFLGPSGTTLDQVFDLAASCVPNGNCNAAAHVVEWYFIRGVSTPLCVADPVPCLPETGASTGLWTFQSVGGSPVFPLQLRETFLSDIASGNAPLDVSFRDFTGTSADSNALTSQSFFTLRTREQYIGSASRRRNPLKPAPEDFFFEGPIYKDRTEVSVRTTPPVKFSTFSLGPDTISVQLDASSPIVLNVARGSNFPDAFSGARKRIVYPWDFQGVYDLLDLSLPMRQLKIQNCVPTSLPAEYDCALAFDNGTMGRLTVSDQKTFLIHYQDCFRYRTIELVPDGAGYSDWYAFDNSEDPYAGTANALQRGQIRTKHIARRLDGVVTVSMGPQLECGTKPRTICRSNETPVVCE